MMACQEAEPLEGSGERSVEAKSLIRGEGDKVEAHGKTGKKQGRSKAKMVRSNREMKG